MYLYASHVRMGGEASFSSNWNSDRNCSGTLTEPATIEIDTNAYQKAVPWKGYSCSKVPMAFIRGHSITTMMRGEGVKKWQNSVHVVVEWPLREYYKDSEYRLHHRLSKFDRSVFLNLEPISYIFWDFDLETIGVS